MANNKNKIILHRFIGGNDEIGYKYEIVFNRSLEHTARMAGGIEKGLDRYDRWTGFWEAIHNLIAHPLLVTKSKWAYRFHDWTANKF